MRFMLRLTHSQGRLDTLEMEVDRFDTTEATDSAARWLRLETNAHPNLTDHYDRWAVHEWTACGAGRVIVTGDTSLLSAE